MSRREERAARLRAVMESDGDAIGPSARGASALTDHALEELEDYEELREAARTIKEDAIERLPELVDRVGEAVEDNGGNVHLATDAAEANRYIREVAADHDADTVAKSKSMTTEELGVNDALAAADVTVHETDLGEFVIQVAGEEPSHLIGPAMHRTPEDIADLFTRELDPEEPLEADVPELTEFARTIVGEHIREADIGMTGANFVVAETGTVALVTNEGNARKTAVTPPVHIAVAGVEKLVPTVEDLQPFAELIARTGTGQDISAYLSLLSPPVDTPIPDFESGDLRDADEREFHLVLVDNGRMAMREDDDLKETLYCIRCGACANTCANFQSVGGHAFGGETYTGGIGTGWEAGVHDIESASEMNDLCTGCSRCVNKCPVKIDIPWINTVVRDRLNRESEPGEFAFLTEGLVPDEEPAGVDVQKRFFGHIDTVARLGSAVAPVANRLAESGLARRALERAIGVDARRPLPRFAPETLHEWAGTRAVTVDDPDREVVLYPDVYTTYFDVERGKAAVRVLEALGCHVRVPDIPESGRAPLSQGMVETARERARAVYGSLAEHVDAGRDIVVVEPSDLAMFRTDYDRLLNERSAERLREASHGVGEYLHGLLANGADGDALARGDGDPVAYHSHCQQRTLGLAAHTVAVLEELGYDVTTSDVECCGMAGSFGYKTEYYDVGVDVGEHFVEAFDTDGRTVVASGTSCGDQFEHLTGREAAHPVELLDPGA